MINRIIRKINIPANGAKLAKGVMGESYPAFVENITSLASQKYEGIIFDTPSPLAQWRGKTHLTKEPGTISWINGFSEGDVFYDVGANIGVYSLYGAVKKNLKVFAFEPSPFNFSTLSRNIILNKVGDRVAAFCLAFSNKTVLDTLYMSSVQTGAAHTGFTVAVNEFGGALNAVHAQATMGFKIDDFITIFNAPAPHHIKIDVDGAEALVIEGAPTTLASSFLRSILIELPSRGEGSSPALLGILEKSGFRVSDEKHPDGDVRLTNYILKRT